MTHPWLPGSPLFTKFEINSSSKTAFPLWTEGRRPGHGLWDEDSLQVICWSFRWRDRFQGCAGSAIDCNKSENMLHVTIYEEALISAEKWNGVCSQGHDLFNKINLKKGSQAVPMSSNWWILLDFNQWSIISLPPGGQRSQIRPSMSYSHRHLLSWWAGWESAFLSILHDGGESYSRPWKRLHNHLGD